MLRVAFHLATFVPLLAIALDTLSDPESTAANPGVVVELPSRFACANFF